MAIKTRSVIGCLALVGAAFGTVNLSRLPGDFEGALCGPWG
jgi:hypothetical protein